MTGARSRSIGMRRALPGLAASIGQGVPAPVRRRAVGLPSGRLRGGSHSPGNPAFAQLQTSLEQIVKSPKVDSSEPMLLQADEMVYDNENAKVTAKGNVELYYGNYTLLADRVVYDRGSNTLAAEGNVRIKDPDGAVITADQITLTDDFRDGFIEALKFVTKDDTRIVASSASREAGNVTVFEKGWFTPCKLCEENPNKPPTWRVRAGKITHKRDQATITYQNAFFDFLGVPIDLRALVPDGRPDREAEVGLPHADLQSLGPTRQLGAGPLLFRAVRPLRFHLRAHGHGEGRHAAATAIGATACRTAPIASNSPVCGTRARSTVPPTAISAAASRR